MTRPDEHAAFLVERLKDPAPAAVNASPNPGSRAAIDAGCICPRMDNWNGDPELGRIRGFIYVVGCPVHPSSGGAA